MEKDEMIEIIQNYEHELWERLQAIQKASGKNLKSVLTARSRWGGLNNLLEKLVIEPIL